MSLLIALQGGVAHAITGAGGIASAEAFGVPSIGATVAPASIVTAEAVGAPSLSVSIAPTGIASAEALGSPSIGADVAPSGIASAEAFGVPSLGVRIELQGIGSAEAFGVPTVVAIDDATGFIDGPDDSRSPTDEEEEMFEIAMALIMGGVLETT